MNNVPHLQALPLGTLLDRTIYVYRRHFRKLINHIAIIQLCLLLLPMVFGGIGDLTIGMEWSGWLEMGLPQIIRFPQFVAADLIYGNTDSLSDRFSVMGLVIVLGGYLAITLWLVYTFVLSYLGNACTITPPPESNVSYYGTFALAASIPFFASILCALPLAYFTDMYAVAIWFDELIFMGVAAVTLDWPIPFFTLPFALLGLLISTAGCVAPQVAMFESVGPGACLRRSWWLVRRSFWRAVAAVLIAGALMALVTFVPDLLSGLYLSYTGTSDLPGMMALIIGLYRQVGLLLVLPVPAGIFTMLYYDLRVRHEGYDLELQRQLATGTHYLTLFEQATAKFMACDFPGARSDFQRILDHYPDNQHALLSYGDCCLRSDDPEAAMAVFQQVLNRDPNHLSALVGRGCVKLVQGDREGALADYQYVLKIQPWHTAALYGLACYHALGNAPEEALRYLKQVLRHHAEFRELARIDPDLVSLRNDERFIALTRPR